jgi:hypothetical protein
MTLYISEHARLGFSGVGVTDAPLRSYQLSTLSTQIFPGTGAQFLRVEADAASLFAQTTGVSTGTALSSTNAVRIAANAPPEFFPVVSTAVNLVGSVSTS